MDHRLVLLLLLPAAILLIWLLKVLRCNALASVLAGFITIAAVWGLLYATFNIIVLWEFFQPQASFISVEAMMAGSENDWLLRYLSTVFGWALGLLYFVTCWAMAFAWTAGRSGEGA